MSVGKMTDKIDETMPTQTGNWARNLWFGITGEDAIDHITLVGNFMKMLFIKKHITQKPKIITLKLYLTRNIDAWSGVWPVK